MRVAVVNISRCVSFVTCVRYYITFFVTLVLHTSAADILRVYRKNRGEPEEFVSGFPLGSYGHGYGVRGVGGVPGMVVGGPGMPLGLGGPGMTTSGVPGVPGV